MGPVLCVSLFICRQWRIIKEVIDMHGHGVGSMYITSLVMDAGAAPFPLRRNEMMAWSNAFRQSSHAEILVKIVVCGDGLILRIGGLRASRDSCDLRLLQDRRFSTARRAPRVMCRIRCDDCGHEATHSPIWLVTMGNSEFGDTLYDVAFGVPPLRASRCVGIETARES